MTRAKSEEKFAVGGKAELWGLIARQEPKVKEDAAERRVAKKEEQPAVPESAADRRVAKKEDPAGEPEPDQGPVLLSGAC